MTRFNQKTKPAVQTVVNHQGGTGYKYDPKSELISILATGLDKTFYEKMGDRENRLISIISEVAQKDPIFAAKALVYARTVMGQRSVTHLGAAHLAKFLSGNPLGVRFYSKRERKQNKGGIVFNLGDMNEIMSAYMMLNPGNPKTEGARAITAKLPNSIKKGFKLALENADEYELAKYQAKNRDISLVDIVNLVHPKPSKKMQVVFEKLMKGELKQFNTAEDKNTKSGQVVAEKVKTGKITKAEAEVELKEAKAENWRQLVNERTIGYLALLRNLRNIVTTADDQVFQAAMGLLTDEKRVRKSLVFPHQIDLAFEVLINENSIPSNRRNTLLASVNKAYELAIPNLNELFTYGKTAVVVDTSGSMTNNARMGGKRINSSAVEKAALVAATLCKGIGADLYHFSNRCEKLQYNPLDTINTTKSMIVQRSYGGGTEFNSIFNTLSGTKYDRVFVISDMQGGDSIVKYSAYQSYITKHGKPVIYSVDMCGYGTTMFKQDTKLVQLFGYSSDIYEFCRTAEIDPKAVIKAIEAIEI